MNRDSSHAAGLIAWFAAPSLLDRAASQMSTMRGGVTYSTVPGFGRVWAFDGQTGTTDVNHIQTATIVPPCTYTAWWYAAAGNASGAPHTIIAHTHPTGAAGHIIYLNAGAMSWYDLSSGGTSLFSGVSYGVWYYVAIATEASGSGNVIGYLGNISTNTLTTASSANTKTVSGTPGYVRLGARYDGSWPLNGMIADARLYNRVLSEAEVRHQWEASSRWDLYAQP